MKLEKEGFPGPEPLDDALPAGLAEIDFVNPRLPREEVKPIGVGDADPAVHWGRLTQPRPARRSICHGRPHDAIVGQRRDSKLSFYDRPQSPWGGVYILTDRLNQFHRLVYTPFSGQLLSAVSWLGPTPLPNHDATKCPNSRADPMVPHTRNGNQLDAVWQELVFFPGGLRVWVSKQQFPSAPCQ